MEPNFYESIHCKSQVHCNTCRALTSGGTMFRAMQMSHFLNLKNSEFQCPLSKPWIEKQSEGPVQTIGRASTISPTARKMSTAMYGEYTRLLDKGFDDLLALARERGMMDTHDRAIGMVNKATCTNCEWHAAVHYLRVEIAKEKERELQGRVA